ncbi:hypothetical protein E2986_13745, partial [Frieseomelitta varia]
ESRRQYITSRVFQLSSIYEIAIFFFERRLVSRQFGHNVPISSLGPRGSRVRRERGASCLR